MLLLGSREDNAHLGYLPATCPKCKKESLLAVYLGKRKVTFAALVALQVDERLYLECLECDAKLGVTPDQEPAIRQRMVSRERLASLASGASQLDEPHPAEASTRNAYQILQVDISAEPEVIQAAFKRLALKYHPDRSTQTDAHERMRDLIAAHAVLSDDERKRRYDRSLGIVRPQVVVRPPAMRADEV